MTHKDSGKENKRARLTILFVLYLMFGLGLVMVAEADTNDLNQASETGHAEEPSADEMRRGMRAFFKCRSCHTLKEGEENLAGPNLYDFMGHPAAGKNTFDYTAALSSAGLIWDDATLRLWLLNPSALVNGTKMVFEGMSNEEEVSALISYLSWQTAP